MPAILRHPRFADPVPGYLAEAEALDRAEEREQCMVWTIKAARSHATLVSVWRFLAALAMTGGVLAVAYLTGLGE